MDLISLIIGFVAGAVIALAAYIVIRRSILKGKRDEIIEKAEVEAEKIKNERILQAKEKYLSLKSDHEKMVNESKPKSRTSCESSLTLEKSSEGLICLMISFSSSKTVSLCMA